MSEVVQLGEVAKVKSGFAFKSADWQDDGVPVIKIANVKSGTVVLDGCSFVSEEVAARAREFELKAGDILISMTGYIGEVAKVRNEGRMLLNQRVGRFQIRDAARLDAEYLYQYIRQPEMQQAFAAVGFGAAQPNISPSLIEQQEIRLPDLPTQRRIAGILSAYDELVANNQRRIAVLEQMARALYREWFVYFRAPGVLMGGSELPEGWEVKELQHFGRVITGKTPSKAISDFYGDDIPFVKTPDMHGNMFILDTNEKLSSSGAGSQSNKTLPAGSICVSCIGTIGVVSITTEDCQTNQQINSVALTNEHSREFLYYLLQDAKQTLENLGANGATMGNVNKSKFESMTVLFPPNDVLNRYHRIVEPMFEQILNLIRTTRNLRRTRDLLLPRLMSGRVEVGSIEVIAQ